MAKVFKASTVNYNAEDRFVVDSSSETLIGLIEPDAAGEAGTPEQAAEDPFFAARMMGEEILRMARLDADRARQQGNEDASALLGEAKREAEEMYERSKREGYDYGYADGMDMAKDTITNAEMTLEEARQERERVLSGLEEEIVGVITSALDRLTGVAADIDPRVIINLIRQGFSSASSVEEAKIHVSKADYDAVLERKDEIAAIVGGTNVEIIKNLSFSKGDCVLETAYGNIDCGLDQQLTALKTNIRYIYEGRNG